ncbi:MAG: hypothetical protein ACR2PK_08475 [Acidimicrobiales bacterium]
MDFLIIAFSSMLNNTVAIAGASATNVDTETVFFASSLGSLVGIAFIVLLMDAAINGIRRFRGAPEPTVSEDNAEDNGEEPSGASARARSIADRYGAPGLGVLGVPLVGGTVSAGVGRGVGIAKGKLLVWLSVGTILFCALLTYGIAFIDGKAS